MVQLKKICSLILLTLLCTQLSVAIAPNTFIAYITGFNAPYAVAITPSGLHAYVTEGGTNSVKVINTDETSPNFNTIVAAPNLDGVFAAPNSIAITPNHKYAYVVNNGNNSVLVIDTDPASLSYNNLISAPSLVGVFNNPGDVAISPNSLFAYVINYNNNTVNVIDIDPTSPSFNMVLSTPALDGILSNPFSITITPNGKYGYITNLTGSVTVIDTDPTSPGFNTQIAAPGLAAVTTQPEGMGITADGFFGYVNNGANGDVVVIDTNPASPTFNTVIPAPGLMGTFDFPNDAAATADGNYVYVTNFIGATGSISSVTVIDTNPLSPTYNQTLNTPGLVSSYPLTRYFTLAATPNARYVYAVDGYNNNVSVIFTGIIDQPLNFVGCKLLNRFLLQAEYIDHLTWSAPTTGVAPASYKIYSDTALTKLIATVPATTTPLQYDVHNQSPSAQNTYYIVSVDSDGNPSGYASTTVSSFCS